MRALGSRGSLGSRPERDPKYFAATRTVRVFDKHLFALWTVTGANYNQLTDAAKHTIDFHENLHRGRNRDEADVSWKHKDLIETMIAAGTYGNASLTSDDIFDLIGVWYSIDSAYHGFVGQQAPADANPQNIFNRLKAKGLTKERIEHIRNVYRNEDFF